MNPAHTSELITPTARKIYGTADAPRLHPTSTIAFAVFNNSEFIPAAKQLNTNDKQFVIENPHKAAPVTKCQ
jgi:hypothetical protein